VSKTTENGVSASAWGILAAMGFGAFIAQMFSTVIGPALPTIGDDLDLSLSEQTWTITSYSLAFGTALIAGGRLGDLVGEVRMIVIGFMLFGGGLVLSAMATDGLVMISGRTVQGIGIGVSAPATLSIVVNVFPALRRGFAVGVWGSAHGSGLLVGPFFAGYMLDLLDWRWIFWIAMPLTAMVILITLAATRNYRSKLSSGRYDVIGLILGGGGTTLATYGLQNACDGWTLPATWGALAAGAALLVAFGLVETRTADPLVDFSLWRERLFAGAFFVQSAVGFIYIPMLTFVGSLFFINVLGYSPVKASWVIAITPGVCMALGPPAGRIVDRFGPGIPLAISLVMLAVALFWMGGFTPQTTLAELILPLTLMGAGAGVALPACNTAGMNALKPEQAGMGSGLIQMTFNVPAALGVALVTSIMGSLWLDRMKAELAGRPFLQQGLEYAQALKNGNDDGARALLETLPSNTAAMVKQAMVYAQSSTITISMTALGGVALAGAIMSLLFIGRRR